ncbi:cupin domain-containing protein [Streptosporangium sp. NBC_01810]|uniref:cupin domain-containing protein n=1 Tax=Streptosporangium sp. NBC_01810 TaxID=2975951 RepID=UPI002DDA6220|nr:cupin domain-containing protein [Streptosporangium sp. NBC_01810]WSA28732.1 cupin domain-containing protein [Streptosporangium sp. NBC_01810]
MSDIPRSKQVRVVHREALDRNTTQTPGLIREVAFDARNPDAAHLSAFLSTVKPGAATGAHHHGEQETVLYVISGTARYRWEDRLENVAEAGRGDFVFVPAHVIHQEINASAEYETVWTVVRSGVDPIVVNLPELDEYIEAPAVEYTVPE